MTLLRCVRPVVWTCAVGLLLMAGNATADVAVEITNAGFESLSADRHVVGWTLRPERSMGEVTLEAVTDQPRDGVGAVRVSLTGHGAATVESGPVSLRVGHLYRLRGWIRTEGAVSDPTSRYPTAVPACLSMSSFPFTNHSPSVGGDSDWTEVQMLFIATTAEDRVRLHLGYNGTARGTAWFDDVSIEKVSDIGEYIPPETVRWFGEGFRYDDRGWIFVHVEGEPYERGYQYGALLPD